MKIAWASLLTFSLLMTGQSTEKSIFNGPDFLLLTSPLRDNYPLSKTVGSLHFVLSPSTENLEALENPVEPEQPFSIPICTGIHISPLFVLTTAHCDFPRLHFSKWRIADEHDLSRIEFVTFGKLLRMEFKGRLVPEFRQTMQEGRFSKAVYKNKDLDFVILKLQQRMEGPYLELHTPIPRSDPGPASTPLSPLHLIGHPHGVPLALSSQCQITALEEDFFFHDCDSLEGSSGGALIHPKGRHMLGLHLQGPGRNDGDFFREGGVFESPDDFARRKGCKSKLPDPSCPPSWAYNKAVFLSSIIEDLLKNAPEIWKEIQADK